jgi:hypothetical protein
MEARLRRFAGEYRFVEDTASGCHCSVQLPDRSSTKSRLEAAPSVPSRYNEVLNSRPVDCDGGPRVMARQHFLEVKT